MASYSDSSGHSPWQLATPFCLSIIMDVDNVMSHVKRRTSRSIQMKSVAPPRSDRRGESNPLINQEPWLHVACCVYVMCATYILSLIVCVWGQGKNILNHTLTCMSFADGIGSKIKWLISWPLLLILFFTIPNCGKPRWEKFFMLSFILSTLWIAIFSYLMVWMVSVCE